MRFQNLIGASLVDGFARVAFWAAASVGTKTAKAGNIRITTNPETSRRKAPDTTDLFRTVAPQDVADRKTPGINKIKRWDPGPSKR
jgi:hypothetical protein